MGKGFRVTVEELDTGETQSMVVGQGDYMLIPFAPCYLSSTQAYPTSGTVQLTLKGHSPQPVEDTAPPDPHANQTCGFRWEAENHRTSPHHQCRKPLHRNGIISTGNHECGCGATRPGVVVVGRGPSERSAEMFPHEPPAGEA